MDTIYEENAHHDVSNLDGLEEFSWFGEVLVYVVDGPFQGGNVFESGVSVTAEPVAMRVRGRPRVLLSAVVRRPLHAAMDSTIHGVQVVARCFHYHRREVIRVWRDRTRRFHPRGSNH
jgi:hypothetical protein